MGQLIDSSARAWRYVNELPSRATSGITRRKRHAPRAGLPSCHNNLRYNRPVVCLVLTLLVFVSGCDQQDSATADDTPAAVRPTVASLVPAASDLLIGMGAADHLVAVSSYDPPRPGMRTLPRVGDYQTTDWEKLGALRPDLMIVQIAPERMPPGLVQRAEQHGIRLVNVEINRLDDIFRALDQLGEAIDRTDLADDAIAHLRARLDGVAERVAGREPVRTLIVTDAQARHIVGPHTFLDDLLQIAGGANAAERFGRPYPSIDREMLVAMQPQAILQLMPDAPEHVRQTAQRTWESLPGLPAVQKRRVHLLTEWYMLQPGWHVADIAERFAEALHPPVEQDAIDRQP
jgi:iron complex transport system substrate-binding protein